MIRVLFLFFLVFIPWFSGSVRAQDADVFDRLQKEPVTLFDMGVKRLRGAAQTAAQRVTPSSDPQTLYRVFFDEKQRRLIARFEFRGRAADASQSTCWERRAAAIKETFAVGTTRYVVPITVEERIRRRLGTMFAKEPAEGREVIALGQRLAELTDVEVIINVGPENLPVECRAPVSVLKRPAERP